MAALSYLLACLEGEAAKGWVEPMVIIVILLINAMVSTWQESVRWADGHAASPSDPRTAATLSPSYNTPTPAARGSLARCRKHGQLRATAQPATLSQLPLPSARETEAVEKWLDELKLQARLCKTRPLVLAPNPSPDAYPPTPNPNPRPRPNSSQARLCKTNPLVFSVAIPEQRHFGGRGRVRVRVRAKIRVRVRVRVRVRARVRVRVRVRVSRAPPLRLGLA